VRNGVMKEKNAATRARMKGEGHKKERWYKKKRAQKGTPTTVRRPWQTHWRHRYPKKGPTSRRKVLWWSNSREEKRLTTTREDSKSRNTPD